MAFQPQFYPQGWSRTRKEALERAHHQCELCQVRRGELRRNIGTDELYIVYLAVCHRLWYTTWKQDAETIVLCQRCHNQFDKQYRKRLKVSQQTPLGYAKVYLISGDSCVLFQDARTYIELISAVDVLAIGQEFVVELQINQLVVGYGRYQRTKSGTKLLDEQGACGDLHLVFKIIPGKMQRRPRMQEATG